MEISAIFFDLDGTLTEPMLDFDQIRREAGVPDAVPLLEYIEELGEADASRVAAILERHERQAARHSRLNAGAGEILALAAQLGLRVAIITRNSRRSVETFLARHDLTVDAVVAREDAPAKPSPEPVRIACQAIGVCPEETIMVGDYLFDMQSGRAAGAKTAHVAGTHPLPDDFDVDYRLRSLHELVPIVRELHGT